MTAVRALMVAVAILGIVIGGLVNVLLSSQARTEIGSGTLRYFLAGAGVTAGFELTLLEIVGAMP